MSKRLNTEHSWREQDSDPNNYSQGTSEGATSSTNHSDSYSSSRHGEGSSPLVAWVIVGVLAVAFLGGGATLFRLYGEVEDLSQETEGISERIKEQAEPEIPPTAIIHYRAIDRSASAENDSSFRELRKEFCRYNNAQYQPGDTWYRYEFAARMAYDDSAQYQDYRTDPDCDTFSSPKDINQRDGTSLINVLESILGYVEQERAHNRSNAVAIAILIQHEEPGANQKNTLDPQDREDMRATLEKLTSKGVAIAVISPVKKVVENLKADFDREDKAKICDRAGFKDCVQWAFDKARELNNP